MPQTPSQPTNTGFSPTPNQSTIGQFGNTFGQPGPVGTPGGFGQPAQPAQPMQSTSSQPPQPYVSGLGTGFGTQVGPVAPDDDGLSNDGSLMTQATYGATQGNAGYGHPWQSQRMMDPNADMTGIINPAQTQATYGATQGGITL